MNSVAQPHDAPAGGPQLDNRRVGAALVDLLLLVPVGLAMYAIFGGLTPAAQLLTAAWALYYYFALESGGGQTLGKRLMRIRVVRQDGGRLDMGRVAIRTLLRTVDGMFGYLVGLVVMIATGKRRQRLGDLAAGTIVTRADPVPAAPGPAAASAAPEPAAAPAPTAPPPAPEVPDPTTPLDIGDPLPSAAAAPPPPAELRPFEPLAPEPVEEEPAAVEAPVDRERPDAQRVKPSDMQIVSSPIDMVMGDDEEAGPPPAR